MEIGKEESVDGDASLTHIRLIVPTGLKETQYRIWKPLEEQRLDGRKHDSTWGCRKVLILSWTN